MRPHQIQQVLQFVDSRLHETVTVDDMARQACLSAFHFSRMFKQHIGFAPHTYLRRKRIERASELLLQTGRPIANIALEVGFRTQAHFTSVFREQLGLTPGEFRRAGSELALSPDSLPMGASVEPPYKVLIADDMRDSADTMAALLQSNGLVARTAYDGRHALAVAREWRPDAALVELALPGISGVHVAQALRRDFGDGMRLVAFTAWAEPGIRDDAVAAGFDDVLAKPAEPEAVITALQREHRGLLERTRVAAAEHMHKHMALLETMLNLVGHTTDPVARQRRLDVARRSALSLRASVDRLQLEPALRQAVVERLQQLEARIATFKPG